MIHAGPREVLTIWEDRGGLMLRRDQSQPEQLAAIGRSAAIATMPDSAAVIAWETPEGAIILDTIR